MDSELAAMFGRLEAKIDMVLQLVMQSPYAHSDQEVSSASILTQLTRKQHAVLQMLLSGKTNAQIAERMHITENTAKVHVRLIARRLGVNRRSQIVGDLKAPFDAMPDAKYLAVSGGLPKNWDADWGNGTEQYDSLVTTYERNESDVTSEGASG